MPFGRGRAEEQLRADLRVRQAIPSEPRELGFLCGEVIAGLDAAAEIAANLTELTQRAARARADSQ